MVFWSRGKAQVTRLQGLLTKILSILLSKSRHLYLYIPKYNFAEWLFRAEFSIEKMLPKICSPVITCHRRALVLITYCCVITGSVYFHEKH